MNMIKRTLVNHLGRYFQKKNKLVEGNNSNISNWNIIPPLEMYNIPMTNNSFNLPNIIAHTFWHGEFKRKQLFSLKSFLCTQNMNQFEIWLWMDEQSYELNKDNKELNHLISISNKKIILKKWNVLEEIIGTKLESRKWYFYWDRPLPAVADDLRIVALHKYGGLYFDLDVMFCRDFSDLMMRGEFAYAWESQPFANTAILFLYKKSYLSEHIIDIVKRKLSSQPWAVFRYDINELDKFIVYPCAMFDPLWNGFCKGMPIKEFSDFFREFDDDFIKMESIHSFRDFFPGIYAYHWHNNWNHTEFEKSYFGMFDKEFDKLLM